VWLGSVTVTGQTGDLKVPRSTRARSIAWASCSQTCASVTKQYNLVPGHRAVTLSSWEGNRRSGVALAMRHRLKWFIHLRAQRPKKGR